MNSQPSKIIVAVHGVGDQSRSETIRAVASQFGSRVQPPLPLMPLGYFSVDGSTKVKVSRLDLPDPDDGEESEDLRQLREIGFAEVYWADIPRSITREGDTIEETKAWGKTVVSRAEAVYRRRHGHDGLQPAEFEQAAGVVEEIVESLQVIENLTFIADKMGIFRFDVAPLLRDYVNDVQVVTEFPHLRHRIVGRFHKAMAGILEEATREGAAAPEIYIVAHSEGTVVSFLALLQALAGLDVYDAEATAQRPPRLDTGWIRQVRGYMTLGSPIDKHILLWDKIWPQFEGLLGSTRQADGSVRFDNGLSLPAPIDWRNYYDHGDPIGFQLDTARVFLHERCRCAAFEFPAEHDIGFTRYPLPGKAHTDYWTDGAVFGHFIDHVVLAPPAGSRVKKGRARPAAPAPRTRALAWTASYLLPYAVTAVLHLLAVFVLFRGLNAYLAVDMEPATMAARVACLAALLMAVTVVARMARLLKIRLGNPRHWLTVIGLVGGLAAVALLAHAWKPDDVTRPVMAAAALVALSGWWLPRWRRWGRRSLVAFGVLVAIGIVWSHVHGEQRPLAGQPFMVVVLAGAAFVYLWWLAIIVFDLTFIWHRYVRHAVAQSTLMHWSMGEPANGARAPGVAVQPHASGGEEQLHPQQPAT